MNILPRSKQIEVIAALCEGVGIRATARLTGANRETVGRLAFQIGNACAELHDRIMTGVRVARIEVDECWSFVGKKQKRVQRHEDFREGRSIRLRRDGRHSEGDHQLSRRQA